MQSSHTYTHTQSQTNWIEIVFVRMNANEEDSQVEEKEWNIWLKKNKFVDSSVLNSQQSFVCISGAYRIQKSYWNFNNTPATTIGCASVCVYECVSLFLALAINRPMVHLLSVYFKIQTTQIDELLLLHTIHLY